MDDNREVRKLNWITFKEVETRTVDWLIPGYVPRKGITVFGSDGGIGKGATVCSIVSDISSGRETILTKGGRMALPDGFKYSPGRVVWLNAEDAYSEVIKPMLEANGAKTENIIALDEKDIIESGICYSDEGMKADIKAFNPDLIVFDPLQQFLPDKVKMAERNLMRREVGHAMSLAKDCNCAVIIVMHTNKQKGVYGRKRLADSADMWDIARSVLMLGLNENDSGERYLSHEKCNFGKLQDSINFTFNPDRTVNVSGRDQLRDREHILAALKNDMQQSNGPDGSAKDKAKQYILQILKDAEEHRLKAPDLKAELREVYGVGTNAIDAAKAELKEEGRIKYTPTGGGRGGNKREWWVSLT